GELAALPDHRARRSGDRRRRDVRRLARDHLPGVPRPRARHRLRDLGRDGRDGGGDRAARRRRAHDVRGLALDLLPQRPDRDRGRRGRDRRAARDEEHGGFDLPGLATLSAGLFALVIALFRGTDWGWSSGRIVGLFAAAAVLLVSFAVIELRQAAPMFDFRLFRVPTFTGAQITAFAMSSGMFAQFLFIPLYIERVLGYSAVRTGVIFLPLSLVSFVVAPIAGRLSARMPVRILLSGGLALVGVALLLMHGVTLSSTWTTLLAGFIVGGVGIGMVNAPLASTAVSVVEQRKAGMASGINNTFRQIGIATGIAALGAIFQDKIQSQIAASGYVPGKYVHAFAQAVASGSANQAISHVVRTGTPAIVRHFQTLANSAFIHGLNTIFFVAAFVLFAGAICALALVRQRDFVASGPAAAGH